MRTLPALIMLIAGFIASIVTIIKRFTLIEALVAVFLTLLIFYILGCIVRVFLKKFIFPEKKPEEELDESEVETAATEENLEETDQNNAAEQQE